MTSKGKQQTLCTRLLLALPCCLFVLLLNGCAGAQPSPEAAGPRPNEPPYPVILADDPERREAALASWTALAREQGLSNPPAPELQPVTATVRSISATSPPLRLPKVGASAEMSEEEIRESLRRFIAGEARLIGAEPQQLSLVLRTDQADGTKKARYEQRPFRFPLRNGYGVLEISFAADMRVLQISSTCIPDAERLIRAASTAGVSIPATTDEVVKRLTGRTFTYPDSSGATQTLTVSPGEEIKLGELVVYPRTRAGTTPALEFHLAWEITLGRPPSARTIYLDTVTNEVIGTDSSIANRES